jgi:Uma2 family endonuclease
VSRRRAKYEDLMQVPENRVAEIIDGELVTTPRPSSRHALAASAIGARLFDRFNGPPGGADAPGGWWILFEPELHLAEDVLVPDLAGWRRDRMPVLEDVPAFSMPPDWVCEVVSPATGRIDRSRKMVLYAAASVRHLWLVDPTPCTLEVYRLEDDRWVVTGTHGGPEMIRAKPFETIDLDLRRWWREPAA